MRAILWTLALVGCAPLDPTDCRVFSDCTPYVPAGVACGMAHEGVTGDQQTGSSCGDGASWYDPATTTPASGLVSARDDPRPCPDGFYQTRLREHEAGPLPIAHCTAIGTPDVPPRPLDLPEGAVCGLSVEDGFGLCEDYFPATDMACPDGWSLRWIPDIFWDAPADDACTSYPQGDSTGTPQKQFEFIFYCANDDGCTGDECLDGVLDGGLLCGLHADGPYGSDLLAQWDSLLAICPDHPMRVHDAVIREAAAQPATCLGERVDEGCPAGLQRMCTWELVSQCPMNETDNVVQEALCWCATPDAVQGVEAPPTQWVDPPDTDCAPLEG